MPVLIARIETGMYTKIDAIILRCWMIILISCLVQFFGITTVLAEESLHFLTLPPHAVLPSGSECASLVTKTPELIPNNIPFNRTMPTELQLSEFHTHPALGSTPPKSDFMRVDGHYTGSTEMILRWAACKWGIDENIVKAQAWVEHGWVQGGPNPTDGGGDKRYNRNECVRSELHELWNFGCPQCCYQSWGILQTKVYYSWGTWPMIKDSTAFNADYRYAEERACLNGDFLPYFHSAQQQPNTYAADIADGNLDRLVWGCTGMHYSGRWYYRQAIDYIKAVKRAMQQKPWRSLRGAAK
jgi:hypothetical protein